ncbi:MAG: T9SS type A sorting domain-containing protein [Leptolyngbya sp. SIO3F4]|nr:T9SS type A sorting domain-containing protein [Leptolyngbya sp. SIO3F4]
MVQQQIQRDPSLALQLKRVWEAGDAVPGATQKRSGRSSYVIPLVFHVVHSNGVGNISYEQIVDAVRVLNEDFRRTNADASQTRSIFQPYAADSEIEFRLARRDPEGNCTNGVIRINAPNQAFDANNGVKALSYWPSNQYMNVWVVNSIENFSGGAGIILGYAQFPGFGAWNTYGIVIRNDRVGDIGTGTGDRTLTHEVGHCLNLLHTFQSGCGNSCQSSGDRVCDTPPVANSSQACSFTLNTCSNDMQGNGSVYMQDVADQIENYMSYNDCQNMFSLGQRDRMHNVLDNIPQLANLVSQQNLQATGVLNPATNEVCRAEFDTERTVVCAGTPVTFNDRSYFNPSEWNWEFEGGFPAQSTQQNPTVVYNEPGVYAVQLTIGDGTNSTTTNQPAYIEVLPSPGEHMPLEEDFEFTSGGLRANYWYTDDNQNNFGWELSYEEAFSGATSLKMNNFGTNQGSASVLSPPYDLSNMTSAEVSFKVAYAQRTVGNNDVLRVYASSDCGANWSLRFVSGGSVLASLPPSAGPIGGLLPDDWNTFSFVLDASFLQENARLRFDFQSNGGNNLYLDDLNINGDFTDTPILEFPNDGSQDVPVNVTLDWKATETMDYYILQLDTSPSFVSPLLEGQRIDYISTRSDLADSRYTTADLLQNQSYYWRVRAFRGGVAFPWSETWAFNTGDQQTVSVAERVDESAQFRVFPNPTEGHISIVKPADWSGVTLRMLNPVGQVVFERYLTDGMEVEPIALPAVPAGWYLLQFQSSSATQVQRLIIR